jgi:hypothetical protein
MEGPRLYTVYALFSFHSLRTGAVRLNRDRLGGLEGEGAAADGRRN